MLAVAHRCLSVAFLFITSLAAASGVEDCVPKLEVAVPNNDLGTIERFLNSSESKSIIEERAHKIACLVAEKGNLNILEHIVSRYPNTLKKKKKNTYTTIARIAAQSGHLDVVCYIAKMDSLYLCPNYGDIIRTAIGKSQRRDNKTLELVLKLAIEWKDGSCPSIIVLAYEQNDTQIIQYIAEREASLFSGRAAGKNHLKIAIEKNLVNQKFLESLAANDPLMNGDIDSSGSTICHLAARYDRLDIIQFVANRSESLLQKVNNEGQTVFSIAVGKGFVDIVRYVVGRKPTMTVRKYWKRNFWRPNPTTSVLNYLIKTNSTSMDTLKYLVEEKKVPLTITDSYDNETVAHTAALDGKIEILLYLVEKEPSLLTIRNWKRETVLHILATGKYNLSLDTTRFIIQKLPTTDSTGRKDLCNEVGIIAAQNGNIFLLKAVVEAEPSILGVVNARNGTILHILAGNMQLSMEELKFFVEKGRTPLTATNHDLKTVAHIFAEGGHTDLVEYLVDREPSILNSVDHRSETVLHKLARKNALSEKSFGFFIDKGASLLVKNKEGDTVVGIEAKNGNTEILKYLVERESSSLANNSSVLAEISQVAAGCGHPSVLKFVAERVPANLANKNPGS